MFGGHGSASMLEIAKKLEQTANPLQLIFLCGHNLDLAAKLRGLGLTRPAVIEGFTAKVDYFMSLSDFFIGKPGPGSISEALQFGLPVITEHNARTMLRSATTVLGCREPAGDGGARLPGNRDRSRAATRGSYVRRVSPERQRLQEYAIFEAPLILDQIMAEKAFESMDVLSTLAP